MLIAIDVNPEDILMNKNGRIVIKLHYYAQFSKAANLFVTKGETLHDFSSNSAINKKNGLFVGGNGGLTVK